MNHNDHANEERRRQDLAEQAECARLPASGDARIDQYRLVLRALRQPLPLGLPDDFSAQVMRRIRVREQRSAREDAIVTGLLVLLAGLGLAMAFPYLMTGIDGLRSSFPVADVLASQLRGGASHVPWQMLGIAGIGIGAALTLERWLSRPSSPMA